MGISPKRYTEIGLFPAGPTAAMALERSMRSALLAFFSLLHTSNALRFKAATAGQGLTFIRPLYSSK
jgi:hypothetical protein